MNVTPFNNADNFFPQYDVIFHYQKSIGLRNCIMELYLSCSVSTIFLYNLQKIKVEQNYQSFRVYSNSFAMMETQFYFKYILLEKVLYLLLF